MGVDIFKVFLFDAFLPLLSGHWLIFEEISLHISIEFGLVH